MKRTYKPIRYSTILKKKNYRIYLLTLNRIIMIGDRFTIKLICADVNRILDLSFHWIFTIQYTSNKKEVRWIRHIRGVVIICAKIHPPFLLQNKKIWMVNSSPFCYLNTSSIIVYFVFSSPCIQGATFKS